MATEQPDPRLDGAKEPAPPSPVPANAPSPAQSTTPSPAQPDAPSPVPSGTASAAEVEASQTVLTAPRLGLAMLVAAVLGWAGIAFLPMWSLGAPELRDVDMYSPPKLQQALAEEERELYWKNGTRYFGYLGLCFGAVPLLVVAGTGVRNKATIAATGLVVGVVSGLLIFAVGTMLRRYLDGGGWLPVGAGARSLAGDTLVFIAASVLLSLPIMAGILLMRQPHGKQKAVAAPLAGLVAGLFFPIAASFLLPKHGTQKFPPGSESLLALWLGIFAVLVVVFMTTTGDKQREKSSRDEVQPVA